MSSSPWECPVTRGVRASLVAGLLAWSVACARPGLAQDTATVVVGDRVRGQLVSGVPFDATLLQIHADFLEMQLRSGDEIGVSLADVEHLQVLRGRKKRFTRKRSILYVVGAFTAYTAVVLARAGATKRDIGPVPVLLIPLGVPAGLVFHELVWTDHWEGVPLPPSPEHQQLRLPSRLRLTFSIPIG